MSQTARINCRKATHKLSQTDISLYLFPIVTLPLLWKTPISLKVEFAPLTLVFQFPPCRTAPPPRPHPSAATRCSEPLGRRKRQTKHYSRNQTSSPLPHLRPTSSLRSACVLPLHGAYREGKTEPLLQGVIYNNGYLPHLQEAHQRTKKRCIYRLSLERLCYYLVSLMSPLQAAHTQAAQIA